MGRADSKIPHVLVIEDDAGTLDLYREVLQDEGCRVTATTSPDLDPAAVARRDPDLVLLDLRFQHDDRGVDWLERLKTHPESRRIPVLVCSADHRLLGRLHYQLYAWECGVLPKPFGLEEFLAAIHAGVAPLLRGTRLDELHAPADSTQARGGLSRAAPATRGG